MPVWDQPVTELTTHVIAPVVKKHIFAIIEKMNLQTVFKDNIYINYNYSAISKTKDINKNINIKNNRFNVDCNIQLNPANLKWDITSFKYLPGYGQNIFRQQLDYPIFIDPEANVELYEQQVPFTINCSCNMIFLSKSLAHSIVSQIYDLFGPDSTVRLTDIVYDIPIPKFLLEKLYAIYQLRRIHNHTSFDKYIEVCSSGRITFNINRNLNKVELIVNNSGIKMLSTVSFSEDKPSEQQQDSSTNTMSVPFIFDMQFSRPSQFLLRYPIVIDNRLLPIQHVIFNQTDRIRNVEVTHVEKITQEYLENVNKGYIECFNTPFYDDWVTPLNSSARDLTQTPYWVIAVTLDENNDRIEDETFVCIKNNIVSKFSLHPIIQEIIEIQSCESYEYDCLYNIQLYHNNDSYHINELFIKNMWDVLEVGPIFKTKNYHDRYHIVFSEMNDLNFLNPKWTFLLELYGDWIKDRWNLTDDQLSRLIANLKDRENGYDPTLRLINTSIDLSKARTISASRVIWTDIIPQRPEIISTR